ncbi:hypothetical protein DXG01_005608 [Tephrocybe rancida]|nr:hypothetical protein DXG01_005608 [Tephrocybe rancida]
MPDSPARRPRTKPAARPRSNVVVVVPPSSSTIAKSVPVPVPAPPSPAPTPTPTPAAAPPGPTPVKPEPLSIKMVPRPPVTLPNPRMPWHHPDELDYICPPLSESALILHLIEHAFSVPARSPPGSGDPWCVITTRDGMRIMVPKGYRLPLMFAMKFEWESARLVLTSPARDQEWEDYKFDILHVSRLCTRFLDEAREAMAGGGMDRTWRCHTFDRALTRYYRRWLVNREEFLEGFWKEFEEEEYQEDVLGRDWARFVLKGHKGFHLTKEEVADGITWETATSGLEQRPDGRMHWVLPPYARVAERESSTGNGNTNPTPSAGRRKTAKRKREEDEKKKEDAKEDAKKEKEKDKDKEKEEKKKPDTPKVTIVRPIPPSSRTLRGTRPPTSTPVSTPTKPQPESAPKTKYPNFRKIQPPGPPTTSTPTPTTTIAPTSTSASASASAPSTVASSASVPVSSAATSVSTAPTPTPGDSPPAKRARTTTAATTPTPPSPASTPTKKSASVQPEQGGERESEGARIASSPLSSASESDFSPVGSRRGVEWHGRTKVGGRARVPYAFRRGRPARTVVREEEESAGETETKEREKGVERETETEKETEKEKRSEEEETDQEISEAESEFESLRRFVMKWSGRGGVGGGGAEGEGEGEGAGEEDMDIEAEGEMSDEDVEKLIRRRKEMLFRGFSAVKKTMEEEKMDVDTPNVNVNDVDGGDEVGNENGKEEEGEEMTSPRSEKHQTEMLHRAELYAIKSSASSESPPGPGPSGSPPASSSSLTSVPGPQGSASASGDEKSNGTENANAQPSSSTHPHQSATPTLPSPSTPTPTVPAPLPPPPATAPLPSSSTTPTPTASAPPTRPRAPSFDVVSAIAGGHGARVIYGPPLPPQAAAIYTGFPAPGSLKGKEKEKEKDKDKDKEREEGEGKGSPDKRLGGGGSSWDARVIKALERARTVKGPASAGSPVGSVPASPVVGPPRTLSMSSATGGGQGAGQGGQGHGHGHGGGLGNIPLTEIGLKPAAQRAAYYVPQMTNWDRDRDGRTNNFHIPSYAGSSSPAPPALVTPTAVTSSSSTPAPPLAPGTLAPGSGSAPSVASGSPVSQPAVAPIAAAPPVAPPSADMPAATPAAVTVAENVPAENGVSDSAMNVDPPSHTAQPAQQPPSPAMDSLAPPQAPQTPLDTQPVRSPSLAPPPRSATPPPPTPSPLTHEDRDQDYQRESQSQQHTPRAHHRDLPPLPGPALPRSSTFEEFQLTAAAWSGSGSSDPGGDDHHTTRRSVSVSNSEHEHGRELQHNRSWRHHHSSYDGHQSATPASYHPHRHHPYPQSSRPQQYQSSFVTPHQYYPSASAPYRPPPDRDLDLGDVDGSPVATRIVSIVQDTMARLEDVLSASSAGERRRGKRREITSGSASASASASTSGSRARHEQEADGGALDLADIMAEVRALQSRTDKERDEHAREVRGMRKEMEELRRTVQHLEGRSIRQKETNKALEIIDVDRKPVLENGVIVLDETAGWGPSSAASPIDFTGDSRGESMPPPPTSSASNISRASTAHPLAHLIGLEPDFMHHRTAALRREMPTVIKIRDSNSPTLALGLDEGGDGHGTGEQDKGRDKEGEAMVCPPHVGHGVSIDGDGVPLPIKSQRKGRMVFVPIDITGDSD